MGRSGLGNTEVYGSSLVPLPPAIITTLRSNFLFFFFIFNKFNFSASRTLIIFFVFLSTIGIILYFLIFQMVLHSIFGYTPFLYSYHFIPLIIIFFAKVNSEEEKKLSDSFGIRTIPTLVVIRDQIILYSKPGAVPAYSLEGLLDRMAKLDMAQVKDEIEKSKQAQES